MFPVKNKKFLIVELVLLFFRE